MTKTEKANNSKSTGQKTSLMNLLIWCLIVACFIGGLVVNYIYFPALSIYLRIAGWIILLIVMFGLSLLTRQGKSVRKFSKEARAELRKVHWPTRQETVQTTLLVVAMVVLAGLVLWGIDAFFMWVVNLLTGQ